jgi:BarA-like signal transduction histidine kinase
MATIERPTPAAPEREYTAEEVKQTYDRLGLSDPDTRRRLLELAAAAEEQPRVGNWLLADTDTGSDQ